MIAGVGISPETINRSGVTDSNELLWKYMMTSDKLCILGRYKKSSIDFFYDNTVVAIKN